MNSTQQLLAAQKAALRERMDTIRASIQLVKDNSASKQAELDAAITAQAAAAARVEQLSAEVDAIEQPHLAELKAELSALAKADMAITVE